MNFVLDFDDDSLLGENDLLEVLEKITNNELTDEDEADILSQVLRFVCVGNFTF